MSILRESSDSCQVRAAWMGLIRHLKLAQENLVKYELQYRSPLQGENIVMPTSPVSTDIGIYEALEDVGDADNRMRYIYENVPHHQDQIPSPELLRNGSTWNTVLFTSDNSRGTSRTRLSTITEHSPEETVREPKEKGKSTSGYHFYDKNQTSACRRLCIMLRGSMKCLITVPMYFFH